MGLHTILLDTHSLRGQSVGITGIQHPAWGSVLARGYGGYAIMSASLTYANINALLERRTDQPIFPRSAARAVTQCHTIIIHHTTAT